MPNSLGDWGSIPYWVIPKTQKMVLHASLLNTQHYKIWIEGKWSNPEKRLVPSPTPQCNTYWKESLQVALDYSRLTSLLIIIQYKYTYINRYSPYKHSHIYIYIYTHTYTSLLTASLQRVKTAPISVLDMTWNNLMVRLQ